MSKSHTKAKTMSRYLITNTPCHHTSHTARIKEGEEEEEEGEIGRSWI